MIAGNRGNITRVALKWFLEHDAISCVIPGFKSIAQGEDNLQAINVEDFTNRK
ncbi:aldo/keto reductase [Sporosarcina ureae]|nr:aldo/keto reductase [Sporosarcina ureae]